MIYRLVLVLLLCAIAAACSNPSESIEAPDGSVRGASIEGIVRESGTEQPLAGVDVVVVRPANLPQLRTTTDADGQFLLTGLDAGRHLIALRKSGYVTRDRIESSGYTFRVADGERVAPRVLHLIPAGSISGRVFSADGQPARRVAVQLLRESYVMGRKQLEEITPTSARTVTQTDEHGEFRVPGVDPGKYLVRLNPQEASVESVIPGGKAPGPVLYPGTRDPAKAVSVEVLQRKETLLDDVRLAAEVRGWIRVLLIDQSGESLEGFGDWTLEPPGWVGASYPLFRQRILNNAHEFQPDQPGTYDISAVWRGPRGPLVARFRATYNGRDVDKRLTLEKPTGRVSGQVMLEGEGESTSPLAGAEISIGPDIAYFSTIGNDGAFEIPEVYPGQYKLGYVRGLPPDAYVSSARQGSRDVLREDLAVQSGDTRLDVVVSLRGGSLEGTVRDGAGQPVHDAIVALVPESPLRERSDYYGAYRDTRSDQSGTFEIRGITPGAYRAYAWSNVPAGAFRNEEFLGAFRARGASVSIPSGERATLDLKTLEMEP